MTTTVPVLSSLAAIGSTLTGFTESWNRHDTQAMATLFTPDADFVNVLGMHFKGANEIEAVHDELHRTRFRHTRVRQLRHEIQFLSDEIAIAHVLWEMTGDKTMARANDDGVRRGVITHVLVRTGKGPDGEVWRFRVTQNTDVLRMPELEKDPFWKKYL
jgi:uncharacterized protein (TIGR02246 family)